MKSIKTTVGNSQIIVTVRRLKPKCIGNLIIRNKYLVWIMHISQNSLMPDSLTAVTSVNK